MNYFQVAAMVMSTSGGEVTQPESPLDVLSRAASMVESGQSASESDEGVSPPRSSAPPSRSSSFKEIHPKFRKHSATPDYMSQAEASRQSRGRGSCTTPPPPPYSQHGAVPPTHTSSSPEEAPLDFSIRKRSLSPSNGGPPPYKYSNPLRQHSPPISRSSKSPSSSQSSSSHHLPVNPAPSYFRPPPYPRTPSPPPPPSESRPPPPSPLSSS